VIIEKIRGRVYQAIEKVIQPSLRAERSNLVVKQIRTVEIAASQKALLAMTEQVFFNSG